MNRSINKGFTWLTALLLLASINACSKLCNEGYQGSRCNVLTTAKFEGTWLAVDSPGSLTYTDTIAQGTAVNDITLSVSFAGHHFNHLINASVTDTVITIPYQQPDSGGNFVQGTATLNNAGNRLSFNYQFLTGADTPQVINNYTGSWAKQN